MVLILVSLPCGRAENAAKLGGAPAASWQVRVGGSCAAGSAINTINADGSVACVVGPTGAQGPPGPQGPPGSQGPAGTTGQNTTSVYGNGSVTVTPFSSATLVPGLSQTINVPSNSVLYIASDGGVQTTSTATNGFSQVDVVLEIDGVVLSNGAFTRIISANTAGMTSMIQYWGFSVSQVLSAGTHTIGVFAGGTGTGSNATVSGNNTSVLQGQLTVIIIKQ